MAVQHRAFHFLASSNDVDPLGLSTRILPRLPAHPGPSLPPPHPSPHIRTMASPSVPTDATSGSRSTFRSLSRSLSRSLALPTLRPLLVRCCAVSSGKGRGVPVSAGRNRHMSMQVCGTRLCRLHAVITTCRGLRKAVMTPQHHPRHGQQPSNVSTAHAHHARMHAPPLCTPSLPLTLSMPLELAISRFRPLPPPPPRYLPPSVTSRPSRLLRDRRHVSPPPSTSFSRSLSCRCSGGCDGVLPPPLPMRVPGPVPGALALRSGVFLPLSSSNRYLRAGATGCG